MRQHTEGMVGSIIWVLLEISYISRSERIFVKVIAMNSVFSTFLGTQCSFTVPNVLAIFRRGPQTGASNAGGFKSHDFLPIHRLVVEMAPYRAIVISYYGTPIRTRMRPIEWCYFQWPWLTEWLSEIFNDTKHRAASLWQLSFLFPPRQRPQ